MAYIIGPLAGAFFGLVSAFFAQGGIMKRRVFARVLRYGGRWRAQRIAMIAISAAVGVYGAWLYGSARMELLGFQLLVCYMLSAAVTDIRGRYIPNDASLFFAGVFTAYQISFLSLDTLISAALGALLAALLFVVFHLAKRDAVGAGDIKLVAVAGIMTGFPGIFYVLVRAMLAIFVYSIVQLARKKLGRSASVPFAPFMLFGVLI